jgi:signal transduction histidine kinase
VVFCHLVLSYPTGRLQRPADLPIVLTAYAAYLLLQGLRYVFEGDLGPIGWQAPLPHSAWADALSALALVLTLTTLFRLVRRRWLRSRSTRASHRFVLYVLAGIGVVLIADTLASIAGVDRRLQTGMFLTYGIGLVCLPAAFAVGVLRERVLIADIVESLEVATDVRAVRSILAGKIDDPNLEIGLWSPEHQQYIDHRGHLVPAPRRPSAQEVRKEEWNGEPLAYVAYDPALVDQPRLMSGVLAVMRLVLVRIRQIDDLRVHQERVLQAVFDERDRIARDLHDSIQYQLLMLAAEAGEAASAFASTDAEAARAVSVFTAIQSGAGATIEALRETVQGIFPAILTTRGLSAAVDEMAVRAQVPVLVDLPLRRFPRVVEASVYFGIAGVLANAVRYAQPSLVTIVGQVTDERFSVTVRDDGIGGATIRPGGGLATTADRFRILRGAFTVHSPSGQGTTITMELPCA